MTLFSPGRRLFGTACIALLVVAFLHTLGATSEPPQDEAFMAMESAMRGYRVPMGMGMNPSVWDIQRALSFTMSICLAAMGALGIAVGGSRDASTGLVARVALVQAVASAALTVLYAVYQIPPPLICMIVVTALFALASRPTHARA